MNYSHLLNRLRQKWNSKPSVFLVEGYYPVAYEGGYDWIVGACRTKLQAERKVEQLHAQLSCARASIAPLFVVFKKADKAVEDYEKKHHPYDFDTDWEIRSKAKDDDLSLTLLESVRWNADDAFRLACENIAIDPGIPHPASHLFHRYIGSMDGPIKYSVREVLWLRPSWEC